MKRAFKAVFILVLAAVAGLTWAQNAPAQTRSLEICWIDAEGGASTLFIAPTGESLLFDTGYPGNRDRDAKRIHAAAQKAGFGIIHLDFPDNPEEESKDYRNQIFST